jgi:hypothetical protein
MGMMMASAKFPAKRPPPATNPTFKERLPMSGDNPITFAYCVELGHEVTITEARLEYLAMDSPPKRFNFLCSDPHCWDGADGPGVMVVGANYTKPAEEGKKYRTPYFRREPRSAHHREGCMWITSDESVNTDIDLTESEIVRRIARRKMKDLVDIFDPAETARDSDHQSIGILNLNDANNLPNGNYFHRFNKSNLPGKTQTSHFHRLVESYREAKAKLSREEFFNLNLYVKGQGPMRWGKYFCPIRYCMKADGIFHQGVIFGGARLYKRYGKGFALSFIDKINSNPVNLYISSEQLKAFRLSKSLTHVIDLLEEDKSAGHNPYVTVYAMGKINQGKIPGTLSFQVDDLRHIYLSISRLEK